MLVSWDIGNFKSVGSHLSLSLAPITVFVGANSSGKSSIIQSILLIKQTLQYATAERSIALNGPLLKLGNFNDVKNVVSPEGGIRVGWKYKPKGQPIIAGGAGRSDFSSARMMFSDSIEEAVCKVEFIVSHEASAGELSLLQPSLAHCEMIVKSESSDSARVANVSIRKTERRHEYPTTRNTTISSRLAPEREREYYEISHIDSETMEAILEDHPNGEIVGAEVRHFFPVFVAVRFDEAKRRAAQIADAICTLRKPIRFQRDYANLRAPQELTQIIDKWLRANAEIFSRQRFLFGMPEPSRIHTLADVIDNLQTLRRRFLARTGSASFPSLQDLQPKIVEALAASFQSDIKVEFERLRSISEASMHLREYFEYYVRYLGPLRDEPKPLYPLEALGAPTDVGYRGENTAAVLHLNKWRNVDYVQPEQLTTDNSGALEIVTKPLQIAVVEWLSYMGVVDEVYTGDRGKIGHELQVRTAGIDKFHDLTNVGVGVSQVLPIVVMALLAGPGSLLIFEQPELHLHPKVQTRLADFFLSIAASGKQCILETHSEYLIHRLRRRIAEAKGEALTDVSKLYFVEREGG